MTVNGENEWRGKLYKNPTPTVLVNLSKKVITLALLIYQDLQEPYQASQVADKNGGSLS